jgi:hypothetical protein
MIVTYSDTGYTYTKTYIEASKTSGRFPPIVPNAAPLTPFPCRRVCWFYYGRRVHEELTASLAALSLGALETGRDRPGTDRGH